MGEAGSEPLGDIAKFAGTLEGLGDEVPAPGIPAVSAPQVDGRLAGLADEFCSLPSISHSGNGPGAGIRSARGDVVTPGGWNHRSTIRLEAVIESAVG
jgi:hypothetical protein